MGREGIILSIKPQFVEAIFTGRKRFELRRRRPEIEPGTVVYVYCTAPQQAIVGRFTCPSVHMGGPGELWTRFGPFSCVSVEEFLTYFRGVKIGYALEIAQVRPWAEPVGLAALRRIAPRFWPPQFYRRISPAEPLLSCLVGRDPPLTTSRQAAQVEEPAAVAAAGV